MLRRMQASQERFNIKWGNIFTTPIEKIKKLVKNNHGQKHFQIFFHKFLTLLFAKI
jgi:hypothetical protein